jgi:hypothetical protein
VYAIQAVFRSYGGVEGRSVTDAPGGSKLALAVYSALNAEATDYLARTGWKLLHLETIGSWIKQELTSRDAVLSEKMKVVLSDLATWCSG